MCLLYIVMAPDFGVCMPSVHMGGRSNVLVGSVVVYCMFCLLYRQFFVSSTDKLHLRVVCYVSSTDKLHLYVICYVSSTDELNPYVMSSLQMNSTRMLWTHKLNCTHRENDHNALPVVAISCVVACTPILFYVSLRVTSKVGHKKIFKRKFVLICCIWSIFFLCLQIPILKQI